MLIKTSGIAGSRQITSRKLGKFVVQLSELKPPATTCPWPASFQPNGDYVERTSLGLTCFGFHCRDCKQHLYVKNWILPSFLPKIQYFEKNELVSNNENMWYDMETQPNSVKIWDTEKRAFCLLAPKGVLIGVEPSKSCFYCCHLLATFQICYELPVWVHKWVGYVGSKIYVSVDESFSFWFQFWRPVSLNKPKSSKISHSAEKSDRPSANVMLAAGHVDAADLWALMRTRPDTRLHINHTNPSIRR